MQYRLPQTPYREFIAARRRELNPDFEFTIDEEIGPVQIEGELLWFGKTFYDGEGTSGVGGVGYFSPADGRFHTFTAPEIAGRSVSAILVQRNGVLLALHSRGEYGDAPGGILHFDKRTRAFTPSTTSPQAGSFWRWATTRFSCSALALPYFATTGPSTT
jgi:hypothetical protein